MRDDAVEHAICVDFWHPFIAWPSALREVIAEGIDSFGCNFCCRRRSRRNCSFSACQGRIENHCQQEGRFQYLYQDIDTTEKKAAINNGWAGTSSCQFSIFGSLLTSKMSSVHFRGGVIKIIVIPTLYGRRTKNGWGALTPQKFWSDKGRKTRFN